MLLLASLVALTACSQSKQDTKESTSTQTVKETKISESSKKEKELKFVVAPQYEGKTSDLIELGKKLVKEHPEVGSDGNMAIYFTGAVSDGRAALMLVNKTDVDIKKNLNFSITWTYDGKAIFENQKVSYFIKDSGELPSYTATLILLPLNEEQMGIVNEMSAPSKMTLQMSDVSAVEWLWNKKHTKEKKMRLVYLTIGFISLGLGIIGIPLPILPTTPFLLLSMACFAKSSKRFEKWLYQTKLYQTYVADYRETKSIAKERKKWILLQIYILMGISIYLAPIIWVKLALGALTIFITFYLLKVIPNKPENQTDEDPD